MMLLLRKNGPRLDIVAVDGLEPPTQPLTASSKPTELYGTPFFIYCLLPSTKLCEAATPRFCLCRHYPNPAIWAHALLVLALRSLDLRSFNTPLLPWLIRPTSLMSHSSLGLTLLPICHVCCDSVATVTPSRGSYRFGNYLEPPVVFTDWLPSLSSHQPYGLFRCRFVAVTPVMVTQAIPSTMLHYFCLLTGIARCTSLGVCGRWRTRTACSSLFPSFSGD